MSTDVQDLVVIGAGTSGISAARFYLDVHPDAKVILVERDGAVGGVWSKERTYTGFKSQGSTRLGGFSDVPFHPPPENVDEHDFFDAKAMSTYVDEYVDSHTYAGKTIRERVKFDTTAKSLEKIAGLWSTQCSTGDGGNVVLLARKVIVSTGSTSVANMPDLSDSEDFAGPIIHTLDYGRSNVLEDANIKKVAVIGGGKSAADMVYQSVKAGKQVNWIIRKSGKGPGGFVAGKSPGGPYRNVTELGLTRLFSAVVIPSGLGKDSLWLGFLFRSRLGRWLHGFLEGAANKQVLEAAGYDTRPGARESFKKLRTEMDAFWLNSPAGMVHHDDFWDTVAKNVDVWREDIDHLGKSNIQFASRESIEADAILCGTGFKETFPFFTKEQCIDLGLPHFVSDEPPEVTAEWTTLNAAAEKKVLKRFPHLATPPSPPANMGDISTSTTPFRLYNCIIPLSDVSNPSIAFTGFATITNMFACSEISAIYATAYLDGHLSLPPQMDMKEKVVYETSYMRLRCPTYGRIGNFWAFDFFPFVDAVLGEVGLKGYQRSWMGTFLVEDMKGLKGEYLGKFGKESL